MDAYTFWCVLGAHEQHCTLVAWVSDSLWSVTSAPVLPAALPKMYDTQVLRSSLVRKRKISSGKWRKAWLQVLWQLNQE